VTAAEWFTHNATIGVNVELDMTICFLGTRNGEKVARCWPKVDFRENFDPLEGVSDQGNGGASDWLTLSSLLAGSGPVTEKRACTEACGASFPVAR